MKITAEQLYKRQITLKEIGEQGQEKLLQSRVVILGCGGLGSAVAVSLAGSGIGHLCLVDFDLVDISNLHRQTYYTIKDIGKQKVVVLGKHIKSLSPLVKVESVNKAIDKSNIYELISKGDIIVDCTDDLIIKYLINDACVIEDKPLVYGSLYKYDGYVASFNVSLTADSRTANLRDAFPELSEVQVPNCSEVGTLNTIVGIIAFMQANEVIKLVTETGTPLTDKLLIYNSLENSQYTLKLKPAFKSYIEQKAQFSELFKRESYKALNCTWQEETLLIDSNGLKKKLHETEANLKIISVIEEASFQIPFRVDQRIPLSKLDPRKLNLNPSTEYVIVCKKGISSYIATERIKKIHPDLKVFSLKQGTTNY